MSRRPKNPLRPLLEEERQQLMRLSRGQAQWPCQGGAGGSRMTTTTPMLHGGAQAGRQSGDAGAALGARFNVEGLAAVVPRHGGGHPRDDTPEERGRILAEARRSPDRERALRRQELSQASTYIRSGASWSMRAWVGKGIGRGVTRVRPSDRKGRQDLPAADGPAGCVTRPNEQRPRKAAFPILPGRLYCRGSPFRFTAMVRPGGALIFTRCSTPRKL